MVALEKRSHRITKGRFIHPVGTVNVHNFITTHLVDVVIFPFFYTKLRLD